MSIPATEHCNPCDNADFDEKPHRHPGGVVCGRPMYRGDFHCDCDAITLRQAKAEESMAALAASLGVTGEAAAIGMAAFRAAWRERALRTESSPRL